ncbi:MAG: ubiquinone/menaquinone biosynthesis C-methylase UbiE [Lentisphaeria bacterium]|jgi:ubiquinone/menaquinone biosynthesis C-methylase UbiE
MNKVQPLAPPDEGDTTRLSQLLKAGGDDLRLEILKVLEKDSFGVLELCQLFDVKQSGMSHHLKVLATAKLVTRRKEGNSIFYRRSARAAGDTLDELKRSIFTCIDALELNDQAKQNIQIIYQQRALASRSFFSDNVNRFKQQQDLIAAYDVYAEHVKELTHACKPPELSLALEVGPGEGEFLPFLSMRFKQVIALDNSAELLDIAKHHCLNSAFSNIEFVLADTTYCHSIPDQLDCAVINMVLHHTPSPQQMFADVSAALKPGGVLIICDLCQHNQDWAREACGDLWLGFAPQDLGDWANVCGLNEGQSSYFALRNGFQIQIREFNKTDINNGLGQQL